MTATEVKNELKKLAREDKAEFYPRFFRTGKGEYGEGDRFLGVVVPDQRKVARRFRELPFPAVRTLLRSPIHEHRFTGLAILSEKVRRGDDAVAREVFDFTLANVERINNWDLCDLAGPKLIGPFLLAHPKERKLFDRYAKSRELWKRRIAMVSTYPFIRADEYEPTLRNAERYLSDEHDLIHKATGWMLREAGKRDRKTLEGFLDRHAAKMPRTMLRYAIEKLPEARRKRYLRA